MNDQYKAGWNQRIIGPNVKRPRDCKKNEQFLLGWYDCNSRFNFEISLAISEHRNPINPGIIS